LQAAHAEVGRVVALEMR